MIQDSEWAEKRSQKIVFDTDLDERLTMVQYHAVETTIAAALLEAIRRERSRCADICSLKAVECEREAMPDGEFAALDCAKAIISPASEGAKPCTCNELPDYPSMKCEGCRA